jgi:spore coat polysaccharide biosynthesis protein SpsF
MTPRSKRRRVVIIVQARMTSSRLPGKSTMDVAGKPLLRHCLERLQSCRSHDELILATGDSESDDPTAALCASLDLTCVRGSLDDVLARYGAAAEAGRAEVIVRVTGDCPLIDPGIVDQVVDAFLATDCDYASNVHDRSVPLGGDTEVFSRAALDAAVREADKPYEREHVTPFIYMRPERFALLDVDCGLRRDRPYRLCVDTEADLALIRAVFERLGPGNLFPLHEAVTLLNENPALAAMNADVAQKTLEE